MVGASLDRINALFDRRFASLPGSVVLAQLFLGFGWLRAVVAKLVDPDWWAGGIIDEFVGEYDSKTIGWYRPILDSLIVDYTVAWAVVVVALEMFVAVALLTSMRVGTGLAAAIFLNVNFLLVGSTNPSVFYLILQFGLVLWMLESSTAFAANTRRLRLLSVGGVGLAFVCLPYVRTMDPAGVIDDPALVLAMWSVCGVVATVVARRRVHRKRLRMPIIDLSAGARDGERVAENSGAPGRV